MIESIRYSKNCILFIHHAAALAHTACRCAALLALPRLHDAWPALSLSTALLCVIIAGIATGFRDPGYVTNNAADDNGDAAPPGKLAAVTPAVASTCHGAEPATCHVCRIVKPIRSKHCRACGRCVTKSRRTISANNLGE